MFLAESNRKHNENTIFDYYIISDEVSLLPKTMRVSPNIDVNAVSLKKKSYLLGSGVSYHLGTMLAKNILSHSCRPAISIRSFMQV